MIALTVALLASLVSNGLFAVRLRDRGDDVASLERRAAQQEEELQSLRSLLRRAAGGDVLSQVASAVERIRGLKFLRTVKPEVLSDAALKRRALQEFRSENPRSEIDALDGALTALGILDAGDDLYDILVGLHEEQVTGFYDLDTKELVIEASDRTSPTALDRLVLAHEYVHALTDQHYDLTRLDKLFDAGRDDEAAAYLALLEGDATFGMIVYRDDVMTDAERRQLLEERSEIDLDRFNAAPEALQRFLLFPYDEGLTFVTQLVQRGGGFSLVDGAYRDPPASTEQILHPARYLDRRDDPTPVTLPDVARALGSGWREAERGQVGEFDLRVILDEFLPDADAVQGAGGWDGGRVSILESAAGSLVAILTDWDSLEEAREATETFGRWLPLRFGNEGSDLRLEGAVGRGWQSGEGAGAVLRSEDRVLLIVGPDAGSVRRARGAFRGF